MWGFGIQQSGGQGSLYPPESAGSGTPCVTVCSELEPRSRRRVLVCPHRLPLDGPGDSVEHTSVEGSESPKPVRESKKV